MWLHQSWSWWFVFSLRSVELIASIFVFSRPEMGVCQPSVPWLEIMLIKCLLWDIAIWSITVTFEAYPPLPHAYRCQFPLIRRFLYVMYIVCSVVWFCAILASLLSGCVTADHHPPVSFCLMLFGLIEWVCLSIGVRYMLTHGTDTLVTAAHLAADEATSGDQEVAIVTEMIAVKCIVVNRDRDPIPFNCTICFTDVDPTHSRRSIARVAECSHLFHRRCLQRWLNSQGQVRTCPNCRTAVTCIYVSRNASVPDTVQTQISENTMQL